MSKYLDGRHAIIQFDSMKLYISIFMCAIFKLVIVADVLNSPAFCRGFQKPQPYTRSWWWWWKCTLHWGRWSFQSAQVPYTWSSLMSCPVNWNHRSTANEPGTQRDDSGARMLPPPGRSVTVQRWCRTLCMLVVPEYPLGLCFYKRRTDGIRPLEQEPSLAAGPKTPAKTNVFHNEYFVWKVHFCK